MLKSKKFWGIVASFFFLWLAFRGIDWQRLPEIVLQVRFGWLLAMIPALMVERVLRVLRWRIILSGRVIPFYNLYAGLVLGYLFNNLFPARAGEVVRALYLGRKKLTSSSEAFGSVVMERLLDGLVVMAFVGFSVYYFPVGPVIRHGGLTALTFYSMVFIGLLILHYRRNWLNPLHKLLGCLMPAPWHARLLQIQNSFISGITLIGAPTFFFAAMMLGFLAWGASLCTYFLSFQAFNLPFGFPEVILLTTALSLGAMIPSSPGMIGIFQFCCILVLSDMLQQSRETAAAFGILVHSISYLFNLLEGFVIMIIENLTLHDLNQAVSTASSDSTDSSDSSDSTNSTDSATTISAPVAPGQADSAL